jgi:hypothetical protein
MLHKPIGIPSHDTSQGKGRDPGIGPRPAIMCTWRVRVLREAAFTSTASPRRCGPVLFFLRSRKGQGCYTSPLTSWSSISRLIFSVPGRGLEPRLTGPRPVVLPDYTIPEWGRWAASLNPHLTEPRSAASA